VKEQHISTDSQTPSSLRVDNPTQSTFASAILQSYTELAKAKGFNVSREQVPVEGQKGSIITSVLIDFGVGLGAGATWDLLRACVARLRGRPDYDGNTILVIEGEPRTIELIMKEKAD
jgi:hypothetical protein